MQKVAEHTITKPNELRIADYLIGVFHQLPTKSSIKKAIKSGQLLMDNEPATTADIPQSGNTINYYASSQKIKPYPLEIEVVFEDEYLMVVNKPPGLPTSGNLYRTLVAALAHSHPLTFAESNLHSPKPAHRLDSLTSGLILAAKDSKTLFLLNQLFEKRKVQKTYKALVMGSTPDSGKWESDIDSKSAITNFKNIKEAASLKNGTLSLLELSPKTGRTHQLRIHCSEAGFPIYGDPLYAGKTIKNKGLFLSTVGLTFIHPVTSETIEVQIDLPSKFEKRMKNEKRRWERNNGNH